VAPIGAAGFFIAFAAVLSGLGEDSFFGFGFFPGVVALVTWSIATSVALYRGLGAPPSCPPDSRHHMHESGRGGGGGCTEQQASGRSVLRYSVAPQPRYGLTQVYRSTSP